MIKQKVTLVLGAGASAPYGFPLGQNLMSEVIEKLIGESGGRSLHLIQLLKDLGFQRKQQEDFANALHDAKQTSIDAFLQERGVDFLDIGKACIAACLIPYEYLFNLKQMEHELVEWQRGKRWYEYLLNLLGPYKNFAENQLSIITFNYDRSLEYFLFNAIKPRFKVDDKQAIEVMKAVPIFHVYGQLGKPDIFYPEGRGYTPEVSVNSVQQSVAEIHLMHEDREESDVIADYQDSHRLISEAHRIVFIGFGYLEKNIERLMIRDFFHGEEIIAGVYGKAEGEIARDLKLLREYAPNGIPIHPVKLDALSLLKETEHLK
jgi:hypothetical protein